METLVGWAVHINHYPGHMKGTDHMYNHCRSHVLPLQITCIAITDHMYNHYRSHVLPLQITCIAITDHMYCHYRSHVLPLHRYRSFTAMYSHMYNIIMVYSHYSQIQSLQITYTAITDHSYILHEYSRHPKILT